MASFEETCQGIWDALWAAVKTALWVGGIFYALPIILVMVFDFYEFLMLGDPSWSKFNWIASIQRVNSFYLEGLAKVQGMLSGIKH